MFRSLLLVLCSPAVALATSGPTTPEIPAAFSAPSYLAQGEIPGLDGPGDNPLASRESRGGRIVVGTLAGYAAGFAGNIAIYNVFANLCGEGGFGLPTPGNISDQFNNATGCLIGFAVANLVGYMLIVPWGVDGAGDGMNGMGTYSAALYGSSAGFLAAFAPGPQIGFGTAVFIGSLLAPPMAVVGYEFSSAAAENAAIGPAVTFAPYAVPIMREHKVVGAAVGATVVTF